MKEKILWQYAFWQNFERNIFYKFMLTDNKIALVMVALTRLSYYIYRWRTNSQQDCKPQCKNLWELMLLKTMVWILCLFFFSQSLRFSLTRETGTRITKSQIFIFQLWKIFTIAQLLALAIFFDSFSCERKYERIERKFKHKIWTIVAVPAVPSKSHQHGHHSKSHHKSQ